MEPIGTHQDKILETAFGAKLLLVMLDIDGTLAPIALRPEAAQVPETTREILLNLCDSSKHRLAFITGRSVQDAKQLLDIPQAVYAGNHGLEICRQGYWQWQHPMVAGCQTELEALAMKLTESELGKIPGLIVENKELTLSIHYREVRCGNSAFVRTKTRSILKPYQHLFRLCPGKKVLEVRPRIACNKGTAVNFIRSMLDPLGQAKVIFIGDDQTDEDAFSVLNENDIGIRVGHQASSAATYFVRDTKEVALFLRALVSWEPVDTRTNPW
jgi:trehalose 6-phosphate phosphatase